MIKIESQFNEPVLANYKLGRLVGIINNTNKALVKHLDGDTNEYTSKDVILLDSLKGLNKRINKNGAVWDDYTRLNLFLGSHGCTEEVSPIIKVMETSNNE